MSLPPVIRDIRLLPAAQPSVSATSNTISKTDAVSTSKISPKNGSTWTVSPGRSRRASFVEGLCVEIPPAEPLPSAPSAAKAQTTFNTSVFSPLKPKTPSKRSSTPNPSSQGTLSSTAATSASPTMPLGSFPPLHKGTSLGTGPYFLHSSSPRPSSTSNASSSGNSSVASSPTISPSRFSLFHSSSSPTFPLFRPTSPTTGSPKTSFPAFILGTNFSLFPKPPVTAFSASSIAQSEASTTSSRSPTPSPRKPHQGPAASVFTTSASSASSTMQIATAGTASSSTKPKPEFSIGGCPMAFPKGF